MFAQTRFLALLLFFAATCLGLRPAQAYSVLSHEEVVDMAWKTDLVPLLKARFPGITDDDLRQAHAYAYGGSVIQDIGYYPFGSHYFSDLLHYVRPNDFVTALLRDSTTPNEYAFALGALAHYCGDTVGHPFVNTITSDENPPLRNRFGRSVTYAEDPTAHLRTEFGFDVVMVAHGAYSQENYRDFIGFQVSKPLLERAFLETYGIPMDSIIKHEDLAVSTYRHAVSSLIPTMTKIAFVNYKDDIEKAAPGTEKNKFVYRLNQTEYRKDFGKEYTHVSAGGHVLAFVLKIVPKVGPFKALKVSIPDAQQQATYLKSVNETVDQYRRYLAQIHAAPAPLPPVGEKQAADARKAAEKLDKDAKQADKRADNARDPADKQMKQAAAADVQKTAAIASAAAARTEAAAANGPQDAAQAVAAATPIQPPTTPALVAIDMDTGKPSAAGEYILADNTFAHLLDDLMKPVAQGRPVQPTAAAARLNSPAPGASTEAQAQSDRPRVDPALAGSIAQFFAHPVRGATTPARSRKEAEKEAVTQRQVAAELILLKTAETPEQQAAQTGTAR